MTYERFGQEGNGYDIANAYKHAYWSALSTKLVGEKMSRLFLNAHEFGWIDENLNNMDAMRMDLNNNWRGREVAKNYPQSDINFAISSEMSKGRYGSCRCWHR